MMLINIIKSLKNILFTLLLIHLVSCKPTITKNVETKSDSIVQKLDSIEEINFNKNKLICDCKNNDEGFKNLISDAIKQNNALHINEVMNLVENNNKYHFELCLMPDSLQMINVKTP